MNRLVVAFGVLLPLSACANAETTEFRQVTEFEDGMLVEGIDGNFVAVLASQSGTLEVGRNDLTVTVSRLDDTTVDDAALDLVAWQPDDGAEMQGPARIFDRRDGDYAIEHVVLPEGGVWHVDLDVADADGNADAFELAFELSDTFRSMHHDNWRE